MKRGITLKIMMGEKLSHLTASTKEEEITVEGAGVCEGPRSCYASHNPTATMLSPFRCGASSSNLEKSVTQYGLNIATVDKTQKHFVVCMLAGACMSNEEKKYYSSL